MRRIKCRPTFSNKVVTVKDKVVEEAIRVLVHRRIRALIRLLIRLIIIIINNIMLIRRRFIRLHLISSNKVRVVIEEPVLEPEVFRLTNTTIVTCSSNSIRTPPAVEARLLRRRRPS